MEMDATGGSEEASVRVVGVSSTIPSNVMTLVRLRKQLNPKRGPVFGGGDGAVASAAARWVCGDKSSVLWA